MRFASIFEISSGVKLGSGDLSPLLMGLYEEQVKYQDILNPGDLTISRAILVNMRQFLEKFMQPRKSPVWTDIMKACRNDYELPQFVNVAWRYFWNALRNVNVQKDWNKWNPFFISNVQSPFKNKRYILVHDQSRMTDLFDFKGMIILDLLFPFKRTINFELLTESQSSGQRCC